MPLKFSIRQNKLTPYWSRNNAASQSIHTSAESKQNWGEKKKKKAAAHLTYFLVSCQVPGNPLSLLTSDSRMSHWEYLFCLNYSAQDEVSWGSCGSQAVCQRDALRVKAPSGVRGMTMIIMFHKGLLSSFSASKWQSTETSKWRNPQDENSHILFSF